MVMLVLDVVIAFFGLSALESHQIMPKGSWAIPPVGIFAPP